MINKCILSSPNEMFNSFNATIYSNFKFARSKYRATYEHVQVHHTVMVIFPNGEPYMYTGVQVN